MMMNFAHLLLLLSCSTSVAAFQPASTSLQSAITKTSLILSKRDVSFSTPLQRSTKTTATQLYAVSPNDAASLLVSAAASSGAGDATAASSMSSGLLRLLLESLITNGVPAFFTICTIGFAAFLFGRSRKSAQQDLLVSSNPVSELYDDLYGDQQQEGDKNKSMFPFFGGGGSGGSGSRRPGEPRRLPKNAGVPAKEYLKITNLNRKIDSYQYSLTAATQSKAAAAAEYRKESFTRAFLDKTLIPALDDNLESLPASRLQDLQVAEANFLKRATKLVADIQAVQTQLTQLAIDEELSMMGFSSVYDLDPASNNDDDDDAVVDVNATDAVANNGDKNTTATVALSKPQKKKSSHSQNSKKMKQDIAKSKSALLQDLSKDQRQLQQLELDFIKTVIKAVGPKYSAAVRTALLGDIAARGAGGLLHALQERRPLQSALVGGNISGSGVASSLSSSHSASETDVNGESATVAPATTTTTGHRRPSLFVTRFPGDTTASQVANLRQEVTAIVESAKASQNDEVLVILQTGGGTVTGYGLAAAQLLRFKEAGLKLTIAVEQVAASGGYMMCCVADKIIASPFAVLGSIGVISDIPNVYERLKSEGIEFQTVTAGKFKRTLTPTKKVTREDFEKSRKDVEDILVLFRDFVAENRPQLDIDKVATGETWFGTAALERKLCDEIKAVDSVLLDYVHQGYNVYDVAYAPPPADGASAFAGLLPGRGNVEQERNGLVGKGVRWLVRTIASELEATATSGGMNMEKPIEQRYMAVDDQSDRVKMQ